MSRKAKTIRNGLKWRDDRPRWEPSPASRAAGLRGVDLKDLAGAWIADRGQAISLCDGLANWAQAVREARDAGPAGVDARARLKAALDALPAPDTDDRRLRRQLLAGVLAAARAVVDEAAAAAPVLGAGVRSTEALVTAYFAAADNSADMRVVIKPATRKAYNVQKKKFLARFPGRGVPTIARMELFDWYHGAPDPAGDGKIDGLVDLYSLSTANQVLGATAAFFEFATKLGWIAASPAVKLDLKDAPGRLVFWTLEEEHSFTSWCDANDFADVGDGLVDGLWMGARISDLCAANLEDLAGAVWSYVPIKTETRLQRAMPGILPQVRARLDRRAAEAAASGLRHLNATPLLWHPGLGRRHTGRTYWERFRDAKALYLASPGALLSLADKLHQDTRDTCITRLWLAGVEPARMWTWTGHAKESVERILRDHYLVLLEQGQLDMARQLQDWAEAEALKLA